MTGFKQIENLIAERLEQKLADMSPKPKICKGQDILQIRDRSQGELSIFVSYTGLASVNEEQNAPHIAALTREYVVWVVARSAKGHANAEGTKDIAESVIERVMEALMGLRLAKGLMPLRLVNNGLGPAYSDAFGYYPVAFHHSTIIRGSL